MPSKKDLIARVVSQLETELAVVERSARAAHEAATHEESRAEDSHDTRGLEASYLAGAQAARVAELKRLITAFRNMVPRELKADDPIEPGALVELNLDGRHSFIFLVAEGGGFSLSFGSQKVLVITPQAPLGEALIGKRAGEGVEVHLQRVLREYEVVAVS